ncbi:MAG: N-acetyltransferase [Alphaproteobacteria bacterium]|jgi:ribosomal-protein-alanine N-acetyltransferase|nr:N-acetyltransferase [Alphaproteobacteria bacterium]
MKPEIRAIDKTGCALLAELHRMCFAEAWDAEAFATLLDMPGAFAVLADAEATPVGFALARSGGGECVVITLGVVPHHRGKGAGTAMLDAVTAHARVLGAEDMILEVANDNAAAIALYQANGFVPVGRRPGYYLNKHGGRVDAVIMRRSLGS